MSLTWNLSRLLPGRPRRRVERIAKRFIRAARQPVAVIAQSHHWIFVAELLAHVSDRMPHRQMHAREGVSAVVQNVPAYPGLLHDRDEVLAHGGKVQHPAYGVDEYGSGTLPHPC
jgi:hypothetical protein